MSLLLFPCLTIRFQNDQNCRAGRESRQDHPAAQFFPHNRQDAMTATLEEKRYAARVVRHLARDYADAECALRFVSPFQLLIATILSAQCTDERVNIVTAELFARYPTAEQMARATQRQVEKLIQSAGFFRSKAKNIRATSKAIMEQHGGEVPEQMEKLVELAGVGRKTANVVLNCAFGQETFAVDTHILRVGNRTGLAKGKTPEQVEAKLEKRVPQPFRLGAHHWLILHGRYICKARTPECWRCPVVDLCSYRKKVLEKPRGR